jgi:hypothetical protein
MFNWLINELTEEVVCTSCYDEKNINGANRDIITASLVSLTRLAVGPVMRPAPVSGVGHSYYLLQVGRERYRARTRRRAVNTRLATRAIAIKISPGISAL